MDPRRSTGATSLARPAAVALLLASLLVAVPVAAEEDEGPRGVFLGFAPQAQVTREDPPPRDPVGGFQLSILGGVQLRGSASGLGGIALGYYKRSTANLGLEVEASFNRGPSGEVVQVLGMVILQSGARSARMVPYLAIGAGAYRARERLRPAVEDALPDFGIEPVEGEETGPMMAFGFGFRYFLSDSVSFRADYREFRALTGAEGGFFDRLFALRRIAGILSFDL